MGIVARYLKVFVDDAYYHSSWYIASIAEFQAYSNSVNVALNKTASASGYYHTFVPSFGNDGNIPTGAAGSYGWNSQHEQPNGTANQTSTNVWWMVDLGQSFNIEKILLSTTSSGSGYASLKSYRIYASLDNESFTLVLKATNLNNAARTDRITILSDSTAYLSRLGTQLTSPETGWQRFDNRVESIVYTGPWVDNNASNAYQNSEIITQYNVAAANGAKVKITCKCDRIRLIATRWSTNSSSIDIYVDGVLYENVSQYGSSQYQTVFFDYIFETEAIRTIEIVNRTQLYMRLDAVDINDSGFLVNELQFFYLIEDGDVYYTFSPSPTGTSLTTIGSVSSTPLSSEVFLLQGFTDTTFISSYINQLSTSFQLLGFRFSNQVSDAKLQVVPYDSLMLQTVDIVYVGTIEQFTLSYTQSANSTIRIIVSSDAGSTWKTWQDGWITISPNVSAVLLNGMTPTVFNERTKTDWATLGTTFRFGYAFSTTHPGDVAQIHGLSATISNATSSPSLLTASVTYQQIDPLYFGLLFYDLSGSIYSKSDGTIIKRLDLGKVMANTTSLETAIVLKNGYNFAVEHILITVDDQTSQGELEFSTSSAPFLATDHLLYENALQPDEELTFYVRLKAGLYDTSGGFFYLKAKASVVR